MKREKANEGRVRFCKNGPPYTGKYAGAPKRGTNLVLFDPEAAKAFPTDADVNAALKGVMAIANRIKPRRATQASKS